MNSDKKKMLILGVLALVMIAVGAFSFMGGGSGGGEVAAATEVSPEATEVVAGEGEENSDQALSNYGEPSDERLAVLPYPIRDPFTVPTAFSEKPVEKPAAPVQNQAPPVQPMGNSNNSYGSAPVNPMIGGDLPPLGGSGVGSGGSPIVAKPMYAVKGIMLGSKPLAVFEDSEGNQKLVPVGGSVDGDTQVVAIEKGKVTVSRSGKRHTLVLDEEARND